MREFYKLTRVLPKEVIEVAEDCVAASFGRFGKGKALQEKLQHGRCRSHTFLGGGSDSEEEGLNEYGFTNNDMQELVSQGVKPWDDDAYVGVGVMQSGVDRGDICISAPPDSFRLDIACYRDAMMHRYHTSSKVWMENFGTRKTKAAVADSIKNPGFGLCSSRPWDAHSGREVRHAAYKALLDAKAAGQVRSVGVSN
ncbi:hypothetical protein PAXRUDRAFT_19295 [Paxillus rubicundulus Ve08.2h10]|uniref:Unplaced genomic scaffold scaffold_3538, whole genome shotgun sequence n=1 Tax=Paxillus rubicundulus Ve08.2h10 TaxID=930991 RepID=A0A0D0D4Z5_9AGAM|nr:hypothetical protein PAXRUDRAFT_19295 [Paxillus rubicundulus Ve08.2h10]